MEVSEVFHHRLELCWNTTKEFQHGSPVTEDLGIIPTQEAFQNGRPVLGMLWLLHWASEVSFNVVIVNLLLRSTPKLLEKYRSANLPCHSFHSRTNLLTFGNNA